MENPPKEVQETIIKLFDPVFATLGLRRVSWRYREQSFGDVEVKYESDRLRVGQAPGICCSG
jgi:hypothetical protein